MAPRALVSREAALLGAAALLLTAATAVLAVAPARLVRFSEVRPILAELAGQLPPELETLTSAQLEAAWPGWIARRDRDIRARLEQGDEDTLVNWMLFGTSFTSRPPAVLGAVEAGAADPDVVLRRTIELISARLDDLLLAVAAPGNDERRLFARALLQRRGLRVGSPAERATARDYLRGAVVRVAGEQELIDQELEATRSSDPLVEFVGRSRLFRSRGLSLDTSLIPNYAIEQTLAEVKAAGVLPPGSVARVAIVGPGLDFADKDVGLDAYPPQTVQPFAVLESLERLSLAAPGSADIVLLDISPRIVEHVTRARASAARNVGYTLNLPLLRATPWLPGVRTYWQTFGDRIGMPAQPVQIKTIADAAEVRSVRIRPAAVQRLSVLDLNIVTERLDGAAFDLVIATNVLIYYDAFEQALALSNIGAMLKPGGVLLANIAAPDVKAATIRALGRTSTSYTRAADPSQDIADFIVWYRAAN